jgi:hypothetical protein
MRVKGICLEIGMSIDIIVYIAISTKFSREEESRNEPFNLATSDVFLGYCINGNSVPFHEGFRKNIKKRGDTNDYLSDSSRSALFVRLLGCGPCTT